MNDLENKINTFCYEYNVSDNVLRNFVESVLIGDFNSIESYNLVMLQSCPSEKHEDMKADLKEIVKDMKKMK